MKRLITIFLSSVIGFSLYGQNQPIAIYGDVYVGDAGQMLSAGPMHLEAGTTGLPAGIARVANYGELQLNDSVIFYSNDSFDGLLANWKTVTNTANKVVLRKNFKTNGWYMIGFPFSVNLGPSGSPSIDVKNALDGTGLTRGVGDVAASEGAFDVRYYDPQMRANLGKNVGTKDYWNIDNYNWQRLDTNKIGLDKNLLVAGNAYWISVDPAMVTSDPTTGAWIDFIGTNSADIVNLFAKTNKGVDLSYAHSPVGKFTSETVANSEGWNVFGGLNSTEYSITAGPLWGTPPTVNYTRAIYYREDASGTWKNLIPVDNLQPIRTMRPYAPLFVQTDSTYMDVDNKLKYLSGGGFQYVNNNGITIAQDQSNTVLLRSTTSALGYDLFRLDLIDANNSSVKFEPAYFKFNSSYSVSFRGAEDDLIMETTSKTEPIVWSVVPNGTGSNLVVSHGLPYTESEVILGVNIPAAGTYTFILRDISVSDNLLKSAILWDKATDTKTELLKGDYTFQTSGAVNTQDRFVLFINKSVTSIDQIGTSEIYAYAVNNILTVKNLNTGDKVQVTDITGRVFASAIASSDTYTVTLNQKGVYIVNVRGEKAKTLKVLNK